MGPDATLALRSVGTPWLRTKVFWYVKPSYRGRVLIRGRRLDAARLAALRRAAALA